MYNEVYPKVGMIYGALVHITIFFGAVYNFTFLSLLRIFFFKSEMIYSTNEQGDRRISIPTMLYRLTETIKQE